MKIYHVFCFLLCITQLQHAGSLAILNTEYQREKRTEKQDAETLLLNGIYGQFIEQSAQLNLLIETLAGLISQTNLVKPTERSNALDWLQDARKLNQTLIKTKLPQLSTEQLAPLIVQFSLLTKMIEQAAKNNFAQRPYLSLEIKLPEKLSLQKLEKLITHNQIALSRITSVAQSNGLSSFNLAYRNASKFLNDYRIPTLIATAGTGLAISGIFFLLLEEDQLKNETLKSAHRRMTQFSKRFDGVAPLLSAAGQAFKAVAELGALVALKKIFKKVDNKLRGEEILNKHTNHEYVADISLNDPCFDYIRPLLSPFYRIAEFLENPAQFAFTGLKNCQAILLIAPPGYGKSFTARAAAGLFNQSAGRTAFISVSTLDLLKQMEKSAEVINGIIEEARENAPCVLWIDELHLLGGGLQIEKNAFILQDMLQALDKLNQNADPQKMVFVIGATNRPDLLDNALLRHGRFSQIITIPKPTHQDRISLLQALCKQSAIDPDQIDITYIAQITPDASPSTLNALFEHANFLAKRENRCLETEHLYQAINTIIRNIQPYTPYTQEEKHILATQIAGEALYYALTNNLDHLDAITIRPIKEEIQEKYDWMTKMPSEKNNIFVQKRGAIFRKTEPHTWLTREEIAGKIAQSVAIKTINGASLLTPELQENRTIIFNSLMEHQTQGLPLKMISTKHQQEIKNKAYDELKQLENEVEKLITQNQKLLTTLATQLEKREFLRQNELAIIVQEGQ